MILEETISELEEFEARKAFFHGRKISEAIHIRESTDGYLEEMPDGSRRFMRW